MGADFSYYDCNLKWHFEQFFHRLNICILIRTSYFFFQVISLIRFAIGHSFPVSIQIQNGSTN